MPYSAYILKSVEHNRHYYGHAEEVRVRLARHNAGKVRSTKAFRPWILIYQETYDTKSEAYKREHFFKTIDGYNYLKQHGIT